VYFMEKLMRTFALIDMVALILTIVGGINWGLVGFFGFDLVAFIFGNMSPLARIIYGVVGISAIYNIYFLIKMYDPSVVK